MKKIKLTALMIPLSMLLINCSSGKKTTNTAYIDAKKISYNTDVKPIIANSCTPCHIPPKGRKEPLESYEHVKENIGAIIGRITLPKDSRKFMPPVDKKPALTEDQVAVLINWQKQSMPE